MPGHIFKVSAWEQKAVTNVKATARAVLDIGRHIFFFRFSKTVQAVLTVAML